MWRAVIADSVSIRSFDCALYARASSARAHKAPNPPIRMRRPAERSIESTRVTFVRRSREPWFECDDSRCRRYGFGWECNIKTHCSRASMNTLTTTGARTIGANLFRRNGIASVTSCAYCYVDHGILRHTTQPTLRSFRSGYFQKSYDPSDCHVEITRLRGTHVTLI